MGATTNPYTSQTISNYNASPPPDDGTQTVANQLSWSKHKTKLADPIKTLAESINTAVNATFAKTINTDANVANQISGSLALEWATATIGTDSISSTYSAVLLGTESGATSDTLQVITATGVYNGALLTIRQRNATEEIRLIHATSTAATATGANLYLTGRDAGLVLRNLDDAVTLQYDSNTASGWVQTSGTPPRRVWGTVTYSAGLPVLGSSYGVSSVEHVGVGQPRIHFTHRFHDANYFVSINQLLETSSTDAVRQAIVSTRTATSVLLNWRDSTPLLANSNFIFSIDADT